MTESFRPFVSLSLFLGGVLCLTRATRIGYKTLMPQRSRLPARDQGGPCPLRLRVGDL